MRIKKFYLHFEDPHKIIPSHQKNSNFNAIQLSKDNFCGSDFFFFLHPRLRERKGYSTKGDFLGLMKRFSIRRHAWYHCDEVLIKVLLQKSVPGKGVLIKNVHQKGVQIYGKRRSYEGKLFLT